MPKEGGDTVSETIDAHVAEAGGGGGGGVATEEGRGRGGARRRMFEAGEVVMGGEDDGNG